ncbi:hypothetical protein [Glutamicibacter ardleyensis]|uniref:hypothetical protein n=1 Tax=Glutamicibacter ardleyensis TaxID=225894 RepID=UPI003FCF5BF4
MASTMVPGVDRTWLHNRQEDFKSDVHKLIHDKLVASNGEGAFFCLQTPPTSMTGWTRQFLRTAYPRMVYDVYQKERRQLPTEAETLANLSNTSRISSRGTEYFTDEEYERRRIEQIGDDYMKVSRGLREFKRAEVRAQSLMDGLGIPATVRPRKADRLCLYKMVSQDLSLCEKSARNMLNILKNKQSRYSCDDRLLALWDDYSAEKLETLISTGKQAVRAMVLKALADYQALSKRRHKLLLSSVRKMGNRSAQWSILAESLVNVFIAEEAHPLLSGETEAELEKERRRERAFRRAILSKSDHIYSEVASFEGQRLGETHEDIRSNLYGLFVGTEAKNRRKVSA